MTRYKTERCSQSTPVHFVATRYDHNSLLHGKLVGPHGKEVGVYDAAAGGHVSPSVTQTHTAWQKQVAADLLCVHERQVWRLNLRQSSDDTSEPATAALKWSRENTLWALVCVDKSNLLLSDSYGRLCLWTVVNLWTTTVKSGFIFKRLHRHSVILRKLSVSHQIYLSNVLFPCCNPSLPLGGDWLHVYELCEEGWILTTWLRAE